MDEPAHRSDDRASKANGRAVRAPGETDVRPEVRGAVGHQLKCLFAELTSGPMPDHLLALVEKLETCENQSDEPRRAAG